MKTTVFGSSNGLESVDFVVFGTREKTIPVTETILAQTWVAKHGVSNINTYKYPETDLIYCQRKILKQQHVSTSLQSFFIHGQMAESMTG